MTNEKRLIPFGNKVTLDDLPFGAIFAFGGDCIAVKSEYRCDNGLIEAFIIDSGEQFWGGVHSAKEQNELLVQPMEIAEVVHGRWIMPKDSYDIVCSACGGSCWYYDYDQTIGESNYCPNCGADMRGNKDGK